jgi:hypothetical protein
MEIGDVHSLRSLRKLLAHFAVKKLLNRKAKRTKKTKRLNGKYQTFTNYKRAI